MIERDQLRAYVRLHLAEGVGPILFHRLAAAFGGVGSVFAASRRDLMGVEGVGEKTAAAIAAVTDEQADEELTEADRCGAAILCIQQPEYPAALKAIHDPPAVLYVRGGLEPTDAIALAVVGARRCTYYGLEQAQRFGELLGGAGMTVVSGGARGIDAAAHRGAMNARGRTIAVMGCGLCQTYPPDNDKLFRQIVEDGRGAIVSELPMRTAVLGGNFPTRNRIISGLSLGVLIVEAARRSGSLITAKEALEQNREVFAVPGRVDSPLSQGANELIRDGARLAQTLEDVLDHLGEVGAKMTPEQPTIEQKILPGLNEAELKLFDALKDGPLGLDDLVRRTEIPSGPAASAMTMLVLKGAVVQQPGNVFTRRTSPS